MNKSESIQNLAKALSEFQGKVAGAKKLASNPFYKSKYADLGTIWETVRDPLTECGLSVTQLCSPADDGFIAVETILLHSSGEYLGGTISMKLVKNDPQGAGSAITYARRYALSAILGIHQEDDDANTHTMRQDRTETPKAVDFDVELKKVLSLIETKRSVEIGHYLELIEQCQKAKDYVSLADISKRISRLPDYLSVSDAKIACANIVQIMVDRKIDGFDVETRRKNSFTKHLGTETLNECKDREKLNTYLASLKEKVK